MNNEVTQSKRYYTTTREKHNTTWAENKADIILPHLPASIETIAKKTGYAQATVQKFVWHLMKKKMVIGLSAPGMKPIYERK